MTQLNRRGSSVQGMNRGLGAGGSDSSQQMLPKITTAVSSLPREASSDEASPALVSPISDEAEAASRQKEGKGPNTAGVPWIPKRSSISRVASVKRPTKSRTHNSWTLELATALLSVACFVAILGVLISVNGHSILSWPSSTVSPNAVISLLSTVGKAALLLPITEAISQLKWVSVQNQVNTMRDLDIYDQASRGPFGSLKLLWGFRLRSMLAGWGALLVVISVATDPFTQLLLHVGPHWTLSRNDTVMIPVSNVYEYEPLQNVNMPRDTVMRGAIVATMYGLNSNLPHTCTTGKCTWSDFSTLAVCSRCQNVTAQMKSDCPRSRLKSETPSDTTISYSCKFSLPGGATFTRQTGGNISVRSLQNPSPFLDASAKNLARVNGTFIGLTNISTIRFADFDNEYQQFDATECTLSWCARTYHKPSSFNNILQYESTTESTLKATDYVQYTTFVPVSDAQTPPSAVDQKYTINSLGWSDMSNLLTSMFTPSGFSDDNYVTSTAQNTDALTGNSIERDFTQLLAYHDNISQVVDALATAMSNQVRLGKGSTQFNGTAWRNQTFYYVRWPFYAFHAAFALLGVAFMILAIAWSERKHVPAWKSSSLALLFARLDGWDQGNDGVSNTTAWTPQGLKTAADKMRGGVVDGNRLLVFERASG